MFTQPAELADDVVSAVVQKAWQLRIRRIDHAPVGLEVTTGTRGRIRIGYSLPLMILSAAKVI
jgi:hypothetical protein